MTPAAEARPVRAGRGPRTVRTLAVGTRWTVARPDMWPVALAGFLARGGILLFILPFVVLPTPIGIASFVGADAVTAAGPTERFLVLASIAGVAAGAAVVAGATLAAATDRLVLLAWASDDGLPVVRAAVHPWSTIARILAVRLVGAIPGALAVAWAVPRIADATYRQLTLPDDLLTPIVVRIAAMVPESLVVIVVAVLAGELLTGLATVHVVVAGRGATRSLASVARDLVRRPVPVLTSFAVGVILLVAGIGIPLAAGTAAWDAVRRALTGGGSTVAAIIAAIAFAASVVIALAAAGAVSAWRRAALAEAVADLD